MQMQHQAPPVLAAEKFVLKVRAKREKPLERLKVAVGCLHVREAVPLSNFRAAATALLTHADEQFSPVAIRERRDRVRQLLGRDPTRFDIGELPLFNLNDAISLAIVNCLDAQRHDAPPRSVFTVIRSIRGSTTFTRTLFLAACARRRGRLNQLAWIAWPKKRR